MQRRAALTVDAPATPTMTQQEVKDQCGRIMVEFANEQGERYIAKKRKVLDRAKSVGGILSGLTRGPVRLTLLAQTKAHLGASPVLNRHKEKDLEDISRRT